MQGPNYLDLAKVIADSHLDQPAHEPTPHSPTRAGPTGVVRQWVGQRLINVGERLVPGPNELQLSTGPPCP